MLSLFGLETFNSEPNPAFVGREIAGPLFFQIVDVLKQTHNTNPTWRNSYGLDIKKIKVCSVSGHLPGPHCHHQRDTWFIPGKSPITTCEIHREVLISNQTGQRLCKTPQNPQNWRTPKFLSFGPPTLYQLSNVLV